MPETFNVAIKDRIKQLRESGGLTQQQVAERSGLALSIVTKLEYGLTEDPRWSTMVALARGLGCSVADLLDEDESK